MLSGNRQRSNMVDLPNSARGTHALTPAPVPRYCGDGDAPASPGHVLTPLYIFLSFPRHSSGLHPSTLCARARENCGPGQARVRFRRISCHIPASASHAMVSSVNKNSDESLVNPQSAPSWRCRRSMSDSFRSSAICYFGVGTVPASLLEAPGCKYYSANHCLFVSHHD
jgi:hypothetical protein